MFWGLAFRKVYQSLPVGNLLKPNPLLSLREKVFPLFRLDEIKSRPPPNTRVARARERYEIAKSSTGFF